MSCALSITTAVVVTLLVVVIALIAAAVNAIRKLVSTIGRIAPPGHEEQLYAGAQRAGWIQRRHVL